MYVLQWDLPTLSRCNKTIKGYGAYFARTARRYLGKPHERDRGYATQYGAPAAVAFSAVSGDEGARHFPDLVIRSFLLSSRHAVRLRAGRPTN